MTRQTLKNFALALVLLGLALIPSTSLAQTRLASKLPGKNPASAAAQAASHQARMPDSPSYTYTLLSFPGTLYTYANGINKGATSSKIEIVGGYGTLSLNGGTYISSDVPGAVYTNSPGINDAGDIVGLYCTTSQCISTNEGEQGFILSGGVITTIAIPGGYSTFLIDINNNGVLLGGYLDAAGLAVSFLATP